MKLNYLSPRTFCFSILFVIFSAFNVAEAAIGVAIANANWNTASTWSFNGVNRLPNCGDTVNIPSGSTVTVASQNDYTSCSNPIYIIVGGTLQFSNGNKLQLPCNSTVNILSGGLVKKATAGGGNSTFIEICGTVRWKAGDGDLYGPAILGGNTLPVSLLSFNAETVEMTVDLQWTTASEINNDYFTVEQSTDGENFSILGIVKGSGNSTINRSYSIKDATPQGQLNYYRLKQTDYDGRSTYSKIISAKVRSGNEFQIISFSNVSFKPLSLLLNDPIGGQRQIAVLDLDGRIISLSTLNVQSGLHEYAIENCFLQPGLYSVSVYGFGQMTSKKMLCN